MVAVKQRHGSFRSVAQHWADQERRGRTIAKMRGCIYLRKALKTYPSSGFQFLPCNEWKSTAGPRLLSLDFRGRS